MQIEHYCDNVIVLCLIFWLNSIDTRTPDKIIEVQGPAISRMLLTMTRKPISLEGSWPLWLKTCGTKYIILQTNYSELSQTSKMSFLWKTIFAKKSSDDDIHTSKRLLWRGPCVGDVVLISLYWVLVSYYITHCSFRDTILTLSYSVLPGVKCCC